MSGYVSAVLHALAPPITQIIMNNAFRMFPDSAAANGDKALAKGENPAKPQLSAEAVAMANMMRGIHF